MDNNDVKVELQKYLNKSIEGLLQQYSKLKNTGSLGQSLQSIITEQNGVLVGNIKGNSYVHQIIHGRKPGTMPPLDDLKKWVVSKGIASGKNVDSIAYAIAKKIEKQGIRVPNQYNDGKLLDGIEPMKELAVNIGKVMIDNVREEVKKQLK
jgi:hypothetical protein